jgi:hypothetical protein
LDEKAVIGMEKELKWQKVKKPQPCWSGEIRVDTVNRRFIYENYYINADELFEQLSKEND